MPDIDSDFEPQDEAEMFDETHRADEFGFGEEVDEPDIDEDVYDATSALGDADDDEDEGVTADDYDDDELRALDLEAEDEDFDEDDDANLDDDLEEKAEYDARSGLDRMIDRTAERAAPIEPGLSYTDDLDRLTNPRDDDVEKYETNQPLSDEQLADLGYLTRDEEKAEMTDDQTISEKAEGSREWEDRSFETGKAAAEGSGATAEDVPDEADEHESDLLDEGLEETFPASDPVSAKHIT